MITYECSDIFLEDPVEVLSVLLLDLGEFCRAERAGNMCKEERV
jgi:hypothetical protein